MASCPTHRFCQWKAGKRITHTIVQNYPQICLIVQSAQSGAVCKACTSLCIVHSITFQEMSSNPEPENFWFEKKRADSITWVEALLRGSRVILKPCS